MSVIIIPRKHLRQPHGRVKASPEWIRRGLIFAVIPSSDIDAVSETALQSTKVGGISTGVSPLGVGVAASNGLLSYEIPGDVLRINSGGVTHGFVGSVSAVDNPWGGIFSVSDASGNGSFTLQRSADSSSLAVYRSEGIGILHTGAVSHLLAANNAVVIAQSSGATLTEKSLLQIGDYVSESTVSMGVAVGAQAGPGARLNLFCERGRNTAYGSDGFIAATFSFSRAIDQTEASEINRAPWQLFSADPIRIYSFPTGAISLSINSITASNITQTGARITLGLTR